RLRSLVLNGLEQLITGPDEPLAPAERLQLAQRAVLLDPYREQAHREILYVLARLGRRNDAIVHYQKLERALHAELGVEPEPATREVFEAVRSCANAPNARLPNAYNSAPDRAVWSIPTKPATSNKLSIAVLPFANLSANQKWNRLADGISGD